MDANEQVIATLHQAHGASQVKARRCKRQDNHRQSTITKSLTQIFTPMSSQEALGMVAKLMKKADVP